MIEEEFSNSEPSDSKSTDVTEPSTEVLTSLKAEPSELFTDSEPDPPEPFCFDPWCEVQIISKDGVCLGFRDSFVPLSKLPKGARIKYVPLDDSLYYIEKLMKKLGNLNNKENRPLSKESEEFAYSMSKAKEESNHAHLNDSRGSCHDDFDDDEEKEVLHKGTVDPQGTAGKVMRKCVPDRIAVDNQELLKLLNMDMLDKESQKLAKIFENNKENEEGEYVDDEDEDEDSEYESADEEHENVGAKDNSEIENIVENKRHTDEKAEGTQ